MTLDTMLKDLMYRLNMQPSNDGKLEERLTLYLNLSYREVMGQKGISRLRRNVMTMRSRPNTPYAVLPISASRVYTIQDRDNSTTLAEISIADLRAEDPGLTSTGRPYCYAIINQASTMIYHPPGTFGPIFIRSHSPADVTQTVHVRVTYSPYEGGNFEFSAKLNGTAHVQIAPPGGAPGGGFNNITKLFLTDESGNPTTAAGVVEVTDGASIVYAIIEPHEYTYARTTTIHLWPTPTEEYTYHADVEMFLNNLISLADEPFIPEDFHYVIVEGALMKEYERREKTTLYSVARGRYQSGLADLKLFLARKSGIPGVDRIDRFSHLGPYFPPGS
jgi:hypothetical protein